jgi:drug/metabolite transporter (DMT)-like permease
MTRRGLLLFVAMSVIWGVPYLFIRIAVSGLSPATLVFARTSLAALVLLPVAVWVGGLRGLRARWLPLLAFTTVEIAIPWLFLSSAEQRISSSLAGLLISTVPLVATAVTIGLGNRDRIGMVALLGLLIGLVGVAAIVGFDLRTPDSTALAQLAVVVVGYAIGPVILSRYLADLRPVGVMAVALALCAVVYGPVAVLQRPPAVPGVSVLVSVAVLAFLCTAVAFMLFAALIAEVGPVRSTLITYINPAVAAVLGVAALGESFTPGMAAGFVLVLAGSAVATRRRGPAPDPRPAHVEPG